MAQSGPFLSSPDLNDSSDSSGLMRYTPATGEILAKTRGWVIFRAVLWSLGAFLLIAGLLRAVNTSYLLYLALLVAETAMLFNFAVRVTGFRRSPVSSNMANVVRSLKYLWIINCISAVVVLLGAIVTLINTVM